MRKMQECLRVCETFGPGLTGIFSVIMMVSLASTIGGIILFIRVLPQIERRWVAGSTLTDQENEILNRTLKEFFPKGGKR